jgi:hypothetical protein
MHRRSLRPPAGSGCDSRHLRGVSLCEVEKLYKAIAAILAAHSEYTAKHVMKVLSSSDFGRNDMPSVRTIQWHMKAVRNSTSATGSAYVSALDRIRP